jgi:hypothetical protein
MRIAFAVVVAAVVGSALAPAALSGDNPVKAANQYCKTNKAALVGAGKPYRNHGQCLKAQKVVSASEAKNAAKACKAEMADPGFAAAHGGATFQQHYGTSGANGNGKSQGQGKGNAFGKCVSAKAKEGKAGAQKAEVNAAKNCRAWRAQPDLAQEALVGMSFTQKFGTAKNAFGKCVSAQKKAPQETP